MTKFIPTRVTHLEMTARQGRVVPVPSLRMALMRADNMPVHFYRYLYEQVGRAHHWAMRRTMNDKKLAAHLAAESTSLHVLYVDGCPAGFAETDFADLPESAEIVYFGLVPDYQGRGLSRFFFNEILNAVWDNDPKKIKIQTNTLDNPRALQLYQSAGFSPVGFSEETIKAWE